MRDVGEAAEATEHRVHLIFDFTFDGETPADALTGLTLARVAQDDWVHSDRLAADARRPIGQATLWDWAAWDISPDLHPYVHGILNSYFGDAAADGPLLLRLSPTATGLLDGRYRDAPGGRPAESGLVLTLGPSHRLAALPAADRVIMRASPGGHAVPVVLDDVTLHLFRTNVGLAVVSVRVAAMDHAAAITPDMLVELVPRLGDERRAPALAWRGGWSAPGAGRFSFGQLLGRLIEPVGCRLSKRERVYTYCALVCADPMPAERTRLIGYRISRHYNGVYRPSGDLQGTQFVQTFENVLHASSREGGCTIVAPSAPGAGEPVEFLQDWLRQAHSHVYLPLQVAAMHEYVALMGLAQGAGVHIDPGAADGGTIAALKALTHRFLLFRLRYRLVHVSAISVHDLAYAGTAQALGLDDLAVKIGRDLQAVERHLVQLASDRVLRLERARAGRERTREHNAALYAAIGGGALAYVTLASFGDHLFDFMKSLTGEGHSYTLVARGVFQAAGLALAVWGFLYAWRKQRGGDEELEHLVDHQRHEAALAQDLAEPPDHRLPP